MKRHIPGLHREGHNSEDVLEGFSWSVSIEPSTAGIRSVRFTFCDSLLLNRQNIRPFSHRPSYCTPKALWKLRWFLRDFGYDPDLMGRDEVDEKALMGLRGIVRISHTTLNGRCFLNLGGFAPASEWEELSIPAAAPRR